jgi:hypothetical protein
MTKVGQGMASWTGQGVGEIRDATLLSYYRPALSGYIEAIMETSSPDIRHDLRDQYPYFNRLIERWNINIPDE